MMVTSDVGDGQRMAGEVCWHLVPETTVTASFNGPACLCPASTGHYEAAVSPHLYLLMLIKTNPIGSSTRLRRDGLSSL